MAKALACRLDNRRATLLAPGEAQMLMIVGGLEPPVYGDASGRDYEEKVEPQAVETASSTRR